MWDADRDARKWPGGTPCVAHPPCRAWGNFAWRAQPRSDEKALGLWAVDQVRRFGGVLEHPRGSKLWKAKELPLTGVDEFGGFTLSVNQFAWGHKALKPTFLYICGVSRDNLPPLPRRNVGSRPTHYIADKVEGQKFLSKRSREKTPVSLAHWLVEVASRCQPTTTRT